MQPHIFKKGCYEIEELKEYVENFVAEGSEVVELDDPNFKWTAEVVWKLIAEIA